MLFAEDLSPNTVQGACPDYHGLGRIYDATEAPTVPVYVGLTPSQTRDALRRKAEPSYHGTFTGARRYVLNIFAIS